MASKGRGRFGQRRLRQHGDTSRLQRPSTRKRSLLLAFGMVCIPLVVIAAVLLYIVLGNLAVHNHSKHSSQDSKAYGLDQTYYYTITKAPDVLAVSSWASIASQWVFASFMFILSYQIARQALLESRRNDTIGVSVPGYFRHLMRGDPTALKQYIVQLFQRRRPKSSARTSVASYVHLAAFSLLLAFCISLSIVIGDTLLHVLSNPARIIIFDEDTDYPANKDTFDRCNSLADNDSYPIDCLFSGGFDLLDDDCSSTLQAPLPQNISDAPLPCSLINKADGTTNLAFAPFVYLILQNGISQVKDDFSSSGPDQTDQSRASPFQIVTHADDNTSQSFYFNPLSVTQSDLSDFGYGSDYGANFEASTISISTQCAFATQACKMHNTTLTKIDENNQTIPYDCYADFSGNLGRTPDNGHERAQGWNMSFYEPDPDGTPHHIPLQAQTNPFHFFAVASVNSIDLPPGSNTSDLFYPDTTVNSGGGAIAFALDCTSTVYDLNFTIFNGSLSNLHRQPASPAKASIFQAPMQAGFGQYHLYQAAALAVVNDYYINDSMADSFSQVGLALASGVVDFDANQSQQIRYTRLVGQIHRAAFLFLVVMCFVYPVLGLGITVWAFVLRRRTEMREEQGELAEMCDLHAVDWEVVAETLERKAEHDAEEALEEEEGSEEREQERKQEREREETTTTMAAAAAAAAAMGGWHMPTSPRQQRPGARPSRTESSDLLTVQAMLPATADRYYRPEGGRREG